MTVHKLKESISVGQAGRDGEEGVGWWGCSIITMGDNSVRNLTRLETLLSFHSLTRNWGEVGVQLWKSFFPQSEAGFWRKKSSGQSIASITLVRWACVNVCI